jgi:hypothetical protein
LRPPAPSPAISRRRSINAFLPSGVRKDIGIPFQGKADQSVIVGRDLLQRCDEIGFAAAGAGSSLRAILTLTDGAGNRRRQTPGRQSVYGYAFPVQPAAGFP